MWDDLPKQMAASSRIALIIITVLVIGALGFVGFILIKNQSKSSNGSGITPTQSLKVSGSPEVSPSLSLSPSPSASATPNTNLQIPDGETLVMSSTADTNGDEKDETLVVTKMTSGKYHAYILSSDGKILFENKELNQKPVRIATQTYDVSKETFLSWMLVFTEQSGNLAFIHWNGTAYEIPANGEGI
jgi:hypothetical protein